MSEKRAHSILLVEDDDIDILNVQRVFKKMNYPNPLYIAHNGVEALDMLRGTNGAEKLTPTPQIILLDINMPMMNGLELLKELRKDDHLKSLSAFVLTTSSDPHDLVAAYNSQVAGYVVKPLNFESFSEAFQKMYNFWDLCVFP
jgi:CheY-like chemotaxis protein